MEMLCSVDQSAKTFCSSYRKTTVYSAYRVSQVNPASHTSVASSDFIFFQNSFL